MRLCVALWLFTVSGCHFAYADSPNVPAQPNYEDHVRPILEHHCLVCHGAPSDRGAPTTFTLAQYDDSDDLTVDGVQTRSGSILDQISRDQMPPAAAWGDGLGPNDKATITRWVQRGSPRNAAEAAQPR